MGKVSGENAATQLAEALGLRPSDVASFTLIAEPGGILTAKVKMYPEDDQLREIGTILKTFYVQEAHPDTSVQDGP